MQKPQETPDKKFKKNLQEGFKALKEKDFYLAQSRMRSALQMDQKSALQELKNKFIEKEKVADIESALLLGTTIQPFIKDDPDFLNRCGVAARRAGENEKAKNFFEAAIALEPTREESILNLAAFQADLPVYGSDVKKALKYLLSQADFFYPLYRIEADWSEGVLFELQKEEEEPSVVSMIKKMKQLTKIKDQWSHHRRYNLALYALRNKKANMAIKELELLEEDHCELPFIHLLLALALFQIDKRREALDLLDLEVELNPNSRLILINSGLMGIWSGELERGYRHLALAKRELDEGKIFASSQRLLEEASLSFTQGKVKRAIRFYDALKLEYDDSFLLDRIGNCHLQLGQTAKALDCFERLIKDDEFKETTGKKLQSLHRLLIKKSRADLDESKYAQAAEKAELALRILRDQLSLQHAIWAYKGLGSRHRYELYSEELESVTALYNLAERQTEVQNLLAQSRMSYEEKDFEKAIQYLEASMRVLKTEEAYRHLTKLYTHFKHSRALSDLKKTWQRHLESEERHKKWKKEHPNRIPSILEP